MSDFKNRCPGCRRASCNGCGIFQKLNTNKQVKIQFPERFQIEPEKGVGISFDVGTTTVAGMLWNLEDGSLLDVETGANPQAVFGADVISRIQVAMERQDGLQRMRRLLLERLDEMALQMVERTHLRWREHAEQENGEKNTPGVCEGQTADVENASVGRGEKEENGKTGLPGVKKVTIVGNTAMCEILLGIKPVKLAKAPFIPDYQRTINIEGKELGFRFLQNAHIIILPPIGGYVGADALAVYGYVSAAERSPRIMAVDIGTNGEIILECNGEKYACSAAAGPALEGGAISQGMRAAKGAIDLISLNGGFPMQDIVCRVIGGGRATGICGSGLIAAVALLSKVGVIDSTGYMRSRGEAKAAGISGKICRRIEEKDGKHRFLLTDDGAPVYLEADDIRQLQLSASAIRSGMEILLKKAQIKAGQLDKLYLAGAFGCYIGIESGIAIGLFPDISREKFVQAGNLAGTGAAMALLSEKSLRSMEKASGEIVHVELAEDADFRELFLENMSLETSP